MTDYFEIKPCKGTVACSVVPKKDLRLDLNEVAKKIGNIKVQVPMLIIAEVDKVEVSIYPSGKLLVKSKSQKQIEEIANKIYEMIK